MVIAIVIIKKMLEQLISRGRGPREISPLSKAIQTSANQYSEVIMSRKFLRLPITILLVFPAVYFGSLRDFNEFRPSSNLLAEDVYQAYRCDRSQSDHETDLGEQCMI
jgi:hypothetical protein